MHYYFNILKGFKEDAAGGKRHSLSLFPFFAIDCLSAIDKLLFCQKISFFPAKLILLFGVRKTASFAGEGCADARSAVRRGMPLASTMRDARLRE